MQNENRSAKPRKLIWFASILAITLVLFVGFRPDRAIRVATGVVAAIESFTIPAFGALSDRVGRRPVYTFGAIFSALMSFPLFMLLGTKNAQLGWIVRSCWIWQSGMPPCTARRRASCPSCSAPRCATAVSGSATISRRSSPVLCPH
jgi:MFS family permease